LFKRGGIKLKSWGRWGKWEVQVEKWDTPLGPARRGGTRRKKGGVSVGCNREFGQNKERVGTAENKGEAKEGKISQFSGRRLGGDHGERRQGHWF